MGEFLQANWFWVVLLGLFIWMHRSGMGCGSHDHGSDCDHDGEDKPRRRHEAKEHQH